MAERLKAMDCKSIGKPSLVRIQPHSGGGSSTGRASGCGFEGCGFKPHPPPLNKDSPVAQQVEHLAVNQRVEGSSPFRRERGISSTGRASGLHLEGSWFESRILQGRLV